MEFVEGETLENLIKRSGRLDVKLALEIVSQVAAGLGAIHEQSLVHRDIKPTNIMVKMMNEACRMVKIIDLGLTKAAVNESASEGAISIIGGFVGTPEFASPEQFVGVGVDIRLDLYSLGVTLWEMLTGHPPFRGSPSEVMCQHQQAPLPLVQLKGLPQPVILLLEVLLEKDAARRLQNPGHLLNAIPKITEAIKVRRTITDQSLREIADQRLGASGKAIGILTNLREVIAARRVWLILWPALLMLAIGGGAMLTVNIFLRSKGSSPQWSRTSSPARTVSEKSIAVLPFESLSENKSDSYFADGVQDEILSNLAKVSQLRVISRTSVMVFRPGSNRDLRSIATALDVAQVLEGTVRREGNRVRITTELVDARSDKTLWSESYDRDLTNIFAIQSEIAESVVANLLQAIAFLEQATQVDPAFALAYCQIAKIDDWLYLLDIDTTPERRAHGDEAVKEALRLKPNLPETHLAAGFHLYICYRDYESARSHIAIAKRQLPNSADVLALGAYLDRRQGHWSQSTKALEAACNLDPYNAETLYQLRGNYQILHQYSALEKTFDRLIALEPDKWSLKIEKAYISLWENGQIDDLRAVLDAVPLSIKNTESFIDSYFNLLIYTRDWPKAIEFFRTSSNEEVPFYFDNMVPVAIRKAEIAKFQGEDPQRNPEIVAARERFLQKVKERPDDPTLFGTLSLFDAYLGRKQEAIQEAMRAVELLPVSIDALHGPAFIGNLAIVYALTDELDLAFQTLATSLEIPGGPNYGDLKLDPEFDALRKDPRFDGLLAQLARRK